ncbi:uncharacterized protein K452DRAFT_296334 [Aplosporella prunicola CBS 121167]|uniref:MARVEL domain-containing protein n=1 Tax=Aplosporella prunicola CBS 121167 TaxID=1176127 RepID=A0A6A6BL94_9PEZI|nr:uncharacterized protein K452DRAFT_296334 [Aplosporella prunicola CBS 121167]KAF2144085.1 hypothetical protein K452DRAFT_296334 [Aplosporella prunicola CBS 121167]
MAHESSRRQLTLLLSVLALLCHSTCALATVYLPDEPLHLARHLTLYCALAAVFSLLGLVGTIRRSATLVSIFANHLLLDAVLTTIPRIILLTFLSTLPSTLCGPNDFPNLFHPPTTPSLPSAAGGASALEPRDGPGGHWSRDRCFVLMNTLLGVVACLAVASGVAQWWCALRVRDFARFLAGREQLGQPAAAAGWESRDCEKVLLHEEWRAVDRQQYPAEKQ